MKVFTRAIQRSLCGLAVVGLLYYGIEAQAGPLLLHTYDNYLGLEVTPIIAVNSSKLTSLLPTRYVMVPAIALGLGEADQGLVVIVNFKGVDQATDQGTTT
jgi:hypothetical protein